MPAGRQTVERRQLGLMLRRFRDRAGKTQQQAARAIGRDTARISQVETAKGSFSLEELDALLDFYCVDEAERQTVLELGAQARKRQRGRGYTDQLPLAFERLADLQADAKAIGFYESSIVPGLAQSADYMRAVINAGDGVWWESSQEEVEGRVAFRSELQRRVLDADEPKDLSFVMAERALDEVIGSFSVLRGQVLHLLQLGERPNVAVQVLPRTVLNNPLLGGGLITLDFGSSAPRIAFVPAPYGPSTYHDQEADTVPMFHAYRRVQELALDQDASRAMLIDKLKELE
ncbi:helix-turn-helix transcriptional regulator [Saccharopolyspora shandongensis]|uniref:Helix-turn-helix domain-containing protein n=1 Tax=Saccharopolyspora shandongensis TaxID=418495 RepID=A0A1H3DFF9_9PSEU|nr:helix-turn-helix transcriptional regulator [Saccharopolyspora shandongensis]SDX65070.1 Helix-turn-helix domain-containing protein [Saccharopolyspora shandongensis]